MTSDWIFRVLDRDLRCLAEQIEAYENEEDIWKVAPGIGNSPGTLAVHIAGNIQHYIGKHLGGSDYVRDREAEFSRRDVPRSVILEELGDARSALQAGLTELDDGTLRGEYPEKVGAYLSVGQFMVHLAAHLGYHLGQVDYHRRMIAGQDALPGMISPAKLA
jgi:hypothetical protein